MQDHEKSCFKGRRFACPHCSHRNSQKSLLHEHIKGKHEGNPFKCDFCPDETFVYKKSLNKHIKAVHTPKQEATFKYTCPECEFVSDDRTEYQTHFDRHQNVRWYKCNSIDQAFYSQSQLTGHVRNSCVARMKVSSSASMPTATVSPDKGFECMVCSKVLKHENQYREYFFAQHVENQTRTWYYCEVCISQFLTTKGLQIHNCCAPDRVSHKVMKHNK